MAITIPSASVETFSGTAGTNHTLNLSSANTGDVRTVVIAGNPDGTGTVPAINIPSGWTQLGSQLNTGAASDGMLAIIARVVQGGDGSTVAVTTTQTCMMAGIATTYVGCDSTYLDQTVPTFATGGSPPVSPSITTTTTNTRIVCAALVDGAPTWGDGDIPSGFTLRGTMVNNPPSNGQNLGVADIAQASIGASGTKAWTNGGTEEYVAATFALRELQEGITSVTPSEFDYDSASIVLAGTNFGSTQSTGTIYISDAATLAGSANEVDVSNAVTAWNDTGITLNLTNLSAGELASLHTLGPGARFVIVLTAAPNEYSDAVTAHRPQAFEMVLGAATPGTTTARLSGLTGTFAGGRIEETAAQNPSTTTTDVATDGNREDVWSIQAKALSREVSYDFRVLYGGVVADTLTVTPQATISAGGGASAALTTVVGTSAAGSMAGNVSVALTGVVATAAVGAAGILKVLAITGVLATSALGSLGLSESGSASLTTVAGTAAVGSVGKNRTVALTGVGSTGSVGLVIPTRTKAVTGIVATAAVGSVTKSNSGSSTLTGVAGTGAIGSVGFTESGNVGITGVEGTSVVGTLGVSVGATVALTGEEAISAAGTLVPDTSKSISGTASVGAVGSLQPDSSISISGEEASAAVGSIGFTESGNVGLTGVEATADAGTVIGSASGSIPLTGVEATGSAGNVSFTESGSVGLTGIEVAAEVGSVTASAGASVPLTGIEATAEIGSVGITETGTVALTGVAAIAVAGNVSFTESGLVGLTGVAASSDVGAVVPDTALTLIGSFATGVIDAFGVYSGAPITGVLVAGSVGDINVSAGAGAALTGVEATGVVGTMSFAKSGTVALTGVEASTGIGTISPSGGPLTLADMRREIQNYLLVNYRF